MEDVVGAGVGALRFVFCHKAARFEPHPCHFMMDYHVVSRTRCMVSRRN